MKTDRKLKIHEFNLINASRKLASHAFDHNFLRNKKVKHFDSKLANEIYEKLVSNKEAKISWANFYNEYGMYMGDNMVIPKLDEVKKWMIECSSGYCVMIDYNIFFELEEDKASFIVHFNTAN